MSQMSPSLAKVGPQDVEKQTTTTGIAHRSQADKISLVLCPRCASSWTSSLNALAASANGAASCPAGFTLPEEGFAQGLLEYNVSQGKECTLPG